MGLSLGVGAEDTRWGWNRGLSLGLEKHQHCIDFPLAAGLQQCCTCILYIFVTKNAVGRIKKSKITLQNCETQFKSILPIEYYPYM